MFDYCDALAKALYVLHLENMAILRLLLPRKSAEVDEWERVFKEIWEKKDGEK